MPEQAQVEPPLTLRFDVPLKDFVKHRYLNAKLSANPTCSIGELVVSLERNETSTSTEVPLVQNNSESTSAQMSSADFMDVGVSIPLVDEIDEEVGILVPRVHIAAKDHMQFLIHHFSKRRKLKKRYVKGELLGFKRAVLRDYGNRIMKFTLAIDNFRQIAPPEILHQLLMSNGASNRVNVNNGVQQAASVPQAATASGVIRPEAMTASRSGNNMTGTGGKRRLNGTGSMDASRPPSFVPKDASKSETKPEPSSSIPSSQTGHPGLVESQNKQINTAQQLLAPRNISSTATPESTLRACPPVMNGPGLTAPSVHEIVSNVNSSSAVPIGIPNPVSTLQSENNMAAQSLAPSNDFLDQYLTIGGPLQSLAQMSADIVPTNNPPSNNIQQNPGLPIQPCLRNEHRPMTTLSPQPEPDSSTSTTTLAHQQQSDHGNQTVSANGTVGAATVSIDEQSHNSPLLTSLLSTTADCSQMSADQPGQVQNEESSSNLIQIVSVSTLAEGTISPIPTGVSNPEGTVSSSTSPHQQPQNQQSSIGSVSVVTGGRVRGTTAASAIDLVQSGDEEGEEEEHFDASAPPAKKIATEVKKEPGIDCSTESCQSAAGNPESANSSAAIVVKSQPGSQPVQTCASQCASGAAVTNPPQQSSNEPREFKCWLCDFKYTEFSEIDAHLKNTYRNNTDHTRDRMALLFGLDNPSVLILSDNCAVHLKCLKCDQVQTLLSHYIIHVMMQCPFSHTGRVQHSNSYRTNVFHMIQVVENACVRSEEIRALIKGVNEISICGQSLSCGSLLNKFDVRPHKCEQRSSSSGDYRLKCTFKNCTFEGEKKALISHYCFTHVIRLSNVNISQAEEDYLAAYKARKLEHLLTGPLADWQVFQPSVTYQQAAPNTSLQVPPLIRPVVVPGQPSRPSSLVGSAETLLTGSVGDISQVLVSVGPRPQTTMPSLVSQQHRHQQRLMQQNRQQQPQSRQYQNQVPGQQYYMQQPTAPMTGVQRQSLQSSANGRTNTAIRSAVPHNASHTSTTGRQLNRNYAQVPRVTSSIVNQQQMYQTASYPTAPTPGQTHVNYTNDPRIVPNVQAPQLYFHPQNQAAQEQRMVPNQQSTQPSTTTIEHYYQQQQQAQQQQQLQQQQQTQLYTPYTFAQATQPLSNQTFSYPAGHQQNVQQGYSYQQPNYYTPPQQQQ